MRAFAIFAAEAKVLGRVIEAPLNLRNYVSAHK